MANSYNEAAPTGPPTPRLLGPDIFVNPILTAEIIKEVALWVGMYIEGLHADGCLNYAGFDEMGDILKLLVARARMISSEPRFRIPVLDIDNTPAILQALKDVASSLYLDVEMPFLPDMAYQRVLLDVLLDLAEHASAEYAAEVDQSTISSEQPGGLTAQRPTMGGEDSAMLTVATEPDASQTLRSAISKGKTSVSFQEQNSLKAAEASNQPASSGGRGYFDRTPNPIFRRPSAGQRPILTPRLSGFARPPLTLRRSSSQPLTESRAPSGYGPTHRSPFISRYSNASAGASSGRQLNVGLEFEVAKLQRRIAELKGSTTGVTTTKPPVPTATVSQHALRTDPITNAPFDSTMKGVEIFAVHDPVFETLGEDHGGIVLPPSNRLWATEVSGHTSVVTASSEDRADNTGAVCTGRFEDEF